MWVHPMTLEQSTAQSYHISLSPRIGMEKCHVQTPCKSTSAGPQEAPNL